LVFITPIDRLGIYLLLMLVFASSHRNVYYLVPKKLMSGKISGFPDLGRKSFFIVYFIEIAECLSKKDSAFAGDWVLKVNKCGSAFY
jgi:hypothetical protein